MEQPTGQAAIEFWQAEPRKEPGTWGFWQVWAGRPQHLKAGDILLSKSALEEDKDTEPSVDYVERVVGPHYGRIKYVNQEGKEVSVGMLCHCIIVRWGTHGTLAG